LGTNRSPKVPNLGCKEGVEPLWISGLSWQSHDKPEIVEMYGHKWWLCWKISVQCGRELNFLHSDITVIILRGHILILYNWRPYLSITTRNIYCLLGYIAVPSGDNGSMGEHRDTILRISWWWRHQGLPMDSSNPRIRLKKLKLSLSMPPRRFLNLGTRWR